jgi:anhydro-N-acetylmuramic acid kinase
MSIKLVWRGTNTLRMSESLYIGVLSGTSMDAIDAALVSFEHTSPRLIQTISCPIPEEFKIRCLQFTQHGRGSIDDYGQLDVQAGELFAKTVLALLQLTTMLPEKIHAIGSHGQTIRHRPDANPPFSLQIGDPNIIAERTSIPTIADFRRRDIAAGGQGAPLAPGFHAAVFGSSAENRVIINIGGISNITILPLQGKSIIGFDTGPGNCLMDGWAKQHWNIPYDPSGKIAAQGGINVELLQSFLSDPYFSQKPPKSTGREYFNEIWLNFHLTKLKNTHTAPEDIQATFLALTAQSVANAILEYAPPSSAIYVCGGGAHNPVLIDTLKTVLARPIKNTSSMGIPPDWVEAMLFAWLAKQTLEGKAGNCPSVTGAKRAIPLGGIFGIRAEPESL